MKAKIAQLVEKNSVELDADSHDYMLKTVEECTGEALKNVLLILFNMCLGSNNCSVLVKRTSINKGGTPS